MPNLQGERVIRGTSTARDSAITCQQKDENQSKLEREWDRYWREWDEELKAKPIGSSAWSPFVLKTYNNYRRTIEAARETAARKMQEIHNAQQPQVRKDEVRNETVKVRKMIQELEIANIEARHSQKRETTDSETRKTNLKQEIAEAKNRFAKVELQWKKDQQRERELERLSKDEIELEKEMIQSDFVCAHTQAWQDFVAADEKNANGDRDKWPRFPPALMEEFSNNNNDFDVLNGYSPSR